MNSCINIYSTKKSNPYFITIIILVYFLFSLLGIFNHEIWLDEGHHWLLARDSETIEELIYNTRYEGHPRLWNLILYIITRFTHDVIWMQIVHIVISTITISIFLCKAPFSLLFKILSIFGYAFFYEYNILSRNYILGVLFLFLALSIYKERKNKYILFATYLILASNIHAIFLVITPILILPDFLKSVKQKPWTLSKVNIGLLLFTFGVILSITQVIPPSDTSFFESINNMSLVKKLGRSFLTFYKGVFLIPDFTSIHFWNTNLVFGLSKISAVIFGFLSFFIPLFIFNKNKYILIYIYLAIATGFIFFFITQRVNARSEIIYYLILITGLWIEKYHPEKSLKVFNLIQNKTALQTKRFLVYVILSCHFLSGITAYTCDLVYPFTSAKDVVNYLGVNDYDLSDIITPFCDAPISSYTRKQLYSLCKQEMAGYCDWNVVCKADVLHSKEELLIGLSKHLKNSTRSKLLISLSLPFELEKKNKQWSYLPKYKLKYRFVKGFDQGIVSKRHYTIYEVSYHKANE